MVENADLPKPEPFLELVVHDLDLNPPLSALSAGYEQGLWRAGPLAAHLIEWLPEFTLTYRELKAFDHASAIRFFRRAAAAVYDTDKYEKRGEFGELILHAVLRQVIGTIPAVNKIFFKDSANDTVKGFDAVHVVATGTELQLWLGEAKLYKDLSSAISEAVKSINDHFEARYLRGEFQAIINKIDDSWPFAERLKRLLDPNTSLDDIFDAICVPVLLTYDSDVVKDHTESNAIYIGAFENEIRGAHTEFAEKDLPDIRIHLFLMPLGSKEELVDELHKRLVAGQAL